MLISRNVWDVPYNNALLVIFKYVVGGCNKLQNVANRIKKIIL